MKFQPIYDNKKNKTEVNKSTIFQIVKELKFSLFKE